MTDRLFFVDTAAPYPHFAITLTTICLVVHGICMGFYETASIEHVQLFGWAGPRQERKYRNPAVLLFTFAESDVLPKMTE
jgi:hypothetical protein